MQICGQNQPSYPESIEIRVYNVYNYECRVQFKQLATYTAMSF